ANQEAIRRYFQYACEHAMGFTDKATVQRAELLMEELGVEPTERRVVGPAREAADRARRENKGHKGIFTGAAVELPDGSIVTGRNSPLMHAASALVLNAVKRLAGIPDEIHLLAPTILESIAGMKKDILNSRSVSLDLEETLIALSISAATHPTAERAMSRLKALAGSEVHMTHIPRPGDEAGLRRLGINLTTEPNFSSKNLFQEA
ncbi:MAG TPA: hypothetical protein VM219_04965, partial [Phycisphaerae bacterium]|nr:hypothetical protein [Phycisphaerae bacterium]